MTSLSVVQESLLVSLDNLNEILYLRVVHFLALVGQTSDVLADCLQTLRVQTDDVNVKGWLALPIGVPLSNPLS